MSNGLCIWLFLLFHFWCIKGRQDFPPDGTLILSRNNKQSPYFNSGIIRVQYDKTWGNICYDIFFQKTSAPNVVCHQLGYTGVSSHTYALGEGFGTDPLDIIWSFVSCGSNDYLSISQCSYSTDISNGCKVAQNNDIDARAVVYCYATRIWDSLSFPGMIRLQGGNYSNEGLVEVYCDGQWGTVCNDGFGPYQATVMCRQLGYDTYGNYNFLDLSGSGMSIWMTNVTVNNSNWCFNNNNSCPTADCTHDKDVTLSCGVNASIASSTATFGTCSNIDNNRGANIIFIIEIVGGVVGGVFLAIVSIAIIICVACCCSAKIEKRKKAKQKEIDRQNNYPPVDPEPEAQTQIYPQVQERQNNYPPPDPAPDAHTPLLYPQIQERNPYLLV